MKAEGGARLTVMEICKAFEKLPPQTEVTAYLDKKITVCDAGGDSVEGDFSGMLEIGEVTSGRVFSAGHGWENAAVLRVTEVL